MAADLGLNGQVTGKSKLYQSMNGYVVESFVESILIAIVLISALLMVFFKSFKLGALAMIPNVMPLIFGGAVLNLWGVSLDIGTVLVCSVCLGIAVDDTIHILSSYNQNRQEGRDPEEALAQVLTHTGPALLVTTLLLVAAFGVFAFGTFIPNVYFGVMTATVLTSALVTDLTFLPALLLLRADTQKQNSAATTLKGNGPARTEADDAIAPQTA